MESNSLNVPFLRRQREEDGVEKDMWYYASMGDLNDLASLLSSRVCKVDEQDNDGRTALMWAVDKGLLLCHVTSLTVTREAYKNPFLGRPYSTHPRPASEGSINEVQGY